MQRREHEGVDQETGARAGLSIIGRVAASTSIVAVENLEGSVEIDCLFGDRSNLFFLCVKGDSMMDR
jgi:SOS-response transcriptional repressor LexA